MFHVEQAWREAFVDAAQTLHIPLAPEQVTLFQQYLRELLTWNEKVNLTSITDEREIAVKHFLDSLAVQQALGPGSLLDVGSGAGFPGLPLKILNPARQIILLEPNQKKTAFLRHVIGTLRLSGVSVRSRRVEELAEEAQAGMIQERSTRTVSGQQSQGYANIVTRAVAVLPWLEAIRGLLADGGRFIWCRTLRLDIPVEDRNFLVMQEIRYVLPGVGPRVLTVLGKA